MQASEIRELLKLLDRPGIISFAGGIPDPALFPVESFRQAYAQILAGAAAQAALQYSVSEGYGPLREWLVGHMAKLNVACSVENIFITSGSQQALDYLGKLFLSPNDTALVTWPTYLGALQAFSAYEPAYDRLSPDSNRTAASYRRAAAAAGARVKFAYLSPDFANPTGATWSRAAREGLIRLADELDIAIIEDAAYQALRYDGEPVPPILALELLHTGGDIERARTVYCGSFSKTLSPGLRVGFVVGNRRVIRKLVLIKQAGDLHSSTINQMAVAHLAGRIFEAQVERARNAYKRRRDAMLAALAKYLPASVVWTRPEGGMFVWLTLPPQLDAAALLAEATGTKNIAFVPGRAFHPDGCGANTLRLSFSCADEVKIEEGISRLGELVQAKADLLGRAR